MASGTPVERLGGSFGGDGRLGEFWASSSCGAPFASTWSLQYDAAHTYADGPFGMVTVTAVKGKDRWWFMCCAD